jgi:Trk K+ transport system NAD-binding subunit
MAAREHSDHVRVVLRVFDQHLAERLDRAVDLDLTRSISALAAPAFSAALLGRTRAVSLPLSNVPLRVLETELVAGSPLVGHLMRDVNHGRELRILAVDGNWRPRDDIVLGAGMAVSVVGTREACDGLARAA